MSPVELIARFSSEDPQWRLDAVARLVATGPSILPLLLEAAQDPSVAARVHAVQALGKLQDPGGLAVVVAALGETANNGAVAIAAEKALIAWGRPACGPSVGYVALYGAGNARARAVRVLGNYRCPELPPFLVRLLGDSLDTVRLQAAEALAAMDPDRARLQLPPLLDDRTDFVRWGVAEALVKLDSPLGEVVLAEALTHEETHDWAEELLEQLAQGRRQGRILR
jgi:HEAT repeat protein